MRARRSGQLAALFAAASVGIGLSLSASRPAEGMQVELCSLIPARFFRDSTETAVLGRALPETVLAGQGTIPLRHGPGHYGRRAGPSSYGQTVEVLQVAGADSLTLEQLFRELGHRRIVAVPWDYSADCSPVAWSLSARWVEDTTAGFYWLRLRPKEEWANDYPTLDALTADLQPYPHGIFYQRGYRGTDVVRRGNGLTAQQYFEFFLHLPTWHHLQADSLGATAAARQWSTDNPDLATRFPATMTLRLLGVTPRS